MKLGGTRKTPATSIPAEEAPGRQAARPSRPRAVRWLLALAVGTVVAGVLGAPALAAGPTSTDIVSSKNPSSAGESVTFTATVHGTFPPPLGVVQFFDGVIPLGLPQVLTPDFEGFCDCIPTNHSSTSFSTSSLSVGTHAISVTYPGGLGDLPSSASLVQRVEGAVTTTTVSSSANPSVYGQNVVFTAAVTSSSTPSGSVQFRVDGSDLGGPQPLDGSGHASVSTSGLAAGSHPVSATFTSSNPSMLGSDGSLAGGQTVEAADTTTAVSSSRNPSEFGQTVTFTAAVTVDSPGSGTPTGSVQFRDDGVDLGSARTLDGSGRATLTTSGLSVGSHTISASYTSGSPNFEGSSGSVTQTVNRARTTLAYDGATTGDYHDPALLSATLTRTDSSAAIAGKLVSFTMASESCSATTDGNGRASCTIVPQEPAGSYTVTASYAGDVGYEPSTAGSPFTVTPEETTTTYTGPTAILRGASGVTLRGLLLEDGDPATPIAGRALTLSLGSQSCTATTAATGVASCTLTFTGALGPEPLRAAFAGDAYYEPSSDAGKTAIVFAFPSRGAFTLGDRTVAAAGPATSVTWWGDNWWSLNSLSGGTAPAAFKGFAGTVAGLPASSPAPSCSGTWTTTGGNSPPPASEVPSYMGVLVASSVKKQGTTISGNYVKVVVVRVNPGYAPNPMSAGTGTIVATFCP